MLTTTCRNASFTGGLLMELILVHEHPLGPYDGSLLMKQPKTAGPDTALRVLGIGWLRRDKHIHLSLCGMTPIIVVFSPLISISLTIEFQCIY